MAIWKTLRYDDDADNGGGEEHNEIGVLYLCLIGE